MCFKRIVNDFWSLATNREVMHCQAVDHSQDLQVSSVSIHSLLILLHLWPFMGNGSTSYNMQQSPLCSRPSKYDFYQVQNIYFFLLLNESWRKKGRRTSLSKFLTSASNKRAGFLKYGWKIEAELMLWFNASWQLSTRQPLAHSPHPVGWGRESEKSKTRGLR